MISLYSGEFLGLSVKDLMIPSERVAHVQVGNSLEHALLVLTKSGYTAIPVLDPHYRLMGLISTPIIMDSILGLERIEFEQLDTKKVETAMNTEIPRINVHSNLQSSLDLLVDYPFLCIEDESGIFEGILTRRTVLQKLTNEVKRMNKK
ncbi:cyclic-di-AMP-binding protein CbpB [Mesobacillus sp. AQ2]|jgi:predicted transcriptional regulator|uniref:cyclic-di-AMP-binding protein CbpB n=1 Tax=unclassified Mesobacillus TaxID=2675270 RepID=UPI002040E283|nr:MULTISPECIES: cyclic-di-AMP-binding protein CbpB [unclassified Mesobacillus]MCM3123493.1 CBS domain-containing protein [Mesobacillus sp. MER 33]MCM3233024.1 CBS domain-containing protein [Mesobacillus sp. MER 48]WHX42099.1 cyclic-di-AMP-binding protein CbpB [Mesobacillus sp. AQ2]